MTPLIDNSEFLTYPIVSDAIDYFVSLGFKVEPKPEGRMVWVYNDEGKPYAYFPTTKRWAPWSNSGYPKKHYHCRSPQEFVEKYLNRKFNNA